MENNMRSYCSTCDEVFYLGELMRFDEYHKPQRQKFKMKYCPLCGKELTKFTGWKDERKYWF